MKFDDLTILYIQIIASFMMGWDYYVPESYRKVINAKLLNHLANIRSRINHDIKISISNPKDKIKDIICGLLSLFLCGVTVYGFDKLPAAFSSSPLVAFPTSMFIVYTSASGVNLIIKPLVQVLISIGFDGPVYSVMKFLLTTSKGPFSGLGFVFLLISFLMRYINYSSH